MDMNSTAAKMSPEQLMAFLIANGFTANDAAAAVQKRDANADKANTENAELLVLKAMNAIKASPEWSDLLASLGRCKEATGFVVTFDRMTKTFTAKVARAKAAKG